ncbi:hypothetical protein NDU88_003479 [Pleurodeles waltl]|uniref:Uncharacterized protein n=1 Tax=Pleurodeles waltl TaxID=8319 RepID=A0AAV7T532_PLEWA|nr:hypothetical protein NDU88_003479 [Pleurodeles waltl]
MIVSLAVQFLDYRVFARTQQNTTCLRTGARNGFRCTIIIRNPNTQDPLPEPQLLFLVYRYICESPRHAPRLRQEAVRERERAVNRRAAAIAARNAEAAPGCEAGFEVKAEERGSAPEPLPGTLARNWKAALER